MANRAAQAQLLKPDFLIVGAGIAGVAVAVGLKSRGHSVLLVERDAKPRERFRGEYLQPAAVKILNEIGLDQVFDHPDVTPVRELRFRDLATVRASEAFRVAPRVISDVLVRYPKGSHAVSVSDRLLQERLRDQARVSLGVDFLEGWQVEALNSKNADFSEKPRFCLSKTGQPSVRVSPRFVIGADGRSSSVRSWLGGKKAPANGRPVLGAAPELIVGCELDRGSSYAHRYEVIRTQGEGTFSFFGIGGSRQRVYWNTPVAKNPTAAPDRNFTEPTGKKAWEMSITRLLDQVLRVTPWEGAGFEKVAGAPAGTAWMGPAARGRFFLVGDALAVTTPLGGQGMTCAMIHVKSILDLFDGSSAQKLKQEARARIRLRYSRTARDLYRHTTLLNFFLYHLCFSRSKLARRLGKHVFASWNDNPALSRQVAEHFAGFNVSPLRISEIAEVLGIPRFLAGPAQNLGSRLLGLFSQ